MFFSYGADVFLAYYSKINLFPRIIWRFFILWVGEKETNYTANKVGVKYKSCFFIQTSPPQIVGNN